MVPTKLLAAVILATICSICADLSQNTVSCHESSVDLVVLIDITTANQTAFAVQQQMLLRTIRHISSSTSLRTAVVAFHRAPVVLLELGSPFANDSMKATRLIASLRPRQYIDNSVAKGFDEVAEQFKQYGYSGSRRIVLMAHDGVNTDLVAETIEARNALSHLDVGVFAISGNPLANSVALAGYTGDASKVLTMPEERQIFHEKLDEAIGACDLDRATESATSTTGPPLFNRRAFGVRAARADLKPRIFEVGQDCAHDKADLIIVLDTSGSVFSVFEDQRKIALDFLESFPEFAYQERLQVSVVRFAATADVVLPFLKGREKNDVIEQVKNVKFTGQNTRIAGAVDRAIDELERAMRVDARQVFLLISDGHGQEYWNVVQATGKRLQDTHAEIFAVSASRDYNEAELLIYVGDRSRLFVGSKYTGFIPTLSGYVGGCVTRGKADLLDSAKFEQQIISTIPTDTEPTTVKMDTSAKSTINNNLTKTTTEKDGLLANTPEVQGSGEKETVEGSGESFEGSGEASMKTLSETATEMNEEFLIKVEPSGNANERKKLRDVSQQARSDCDADIVLIIDRSQSVDADFQRQIKTAIKAIELFSERDYANSKIRVGAVSFAKDARVELHLQSGERANIVKVIEQIEHTGGSTSAVEGARLSMARLLSNRRPSARLLTLLFSDGHSQDYWRHLVETAMKLREVPNSVLIAFTASNVFSKPELQVWTGDETKVFLSDQEQPFLQAVAKYINDCSPTSLISKDNSDGVKNGVTPTENSSSHNNTETFESSLTVGNGLLTLDTGEQADPLSKDNQTTIPSDQTTISEKSTAESVIKVSTDNATDEETKAHGIKTASELEKIEEPNGEKDSSACFVDLLFVIDISTSVDREFQRQLQFAVDLVKRLPSEDFEHRIRVGVVTFTSKAQVTLQLGEITSRSAILDSLLGIDNPGGSTSVASGINLAVDELEKRARKGARQMVVLVSDGNSQDHWNDVIQSSSKLQTTGAEVYAVTESDKYMFRELELYAGDKWRVYIDDRIRQFLDEVQTSAMGCGRRGGEKSTVAPTEAVPSDINLTTSTCANDLVDLVFVIDTSSPEQQFYREKELATELLKSLPKDIFESRLSVSLISSEEGSLSQLGAAQSRPDIVYELQRLKKGERDLNITEAASQVVEETGARRRSQSRLIVIFTSSGNSNDTIQDVQAASNRLSGIDASVYGVTLSQTSDLGFFKTLTKHENNVYHGDRVDRFIQDLTSKIANCAISEEDPALSTKLPDTPPVELKLKLKDEENDLKTIENGCQYNNMDLMIILDASASREERQRELALSLIERLPISSSDSHIAVGITSFTATPAIRQSLRTNTEKKTLRDVIEAIPYNGGSTLTARAVSLSLGDLEKSRRKDATQVIVLMNDGISQDLWEDVIETSEKLNNSRAERFGVALGEQVDSRELNRYIGNTERIYRDGSTEKFLSDVVSLLEQDELCPVSDNIQSKPATLAEENEPDCERPNLDLLILFDNTEDSTDGTDPTVNSNRYLLLDVLGSLANNSFVRVAVVSFASRPVVELDFSQISERDRLFASIEAIKAVQGPASYSEAISVAVDTLEKQRRSDTRASLIIVGDGISNDTKEERAEAAKKIRETPYLSTLAVDSSQHTQIEVLEQFAGVRKNVYEFRRNGEFADEIRRICSKGKDPRCTIKLSDIREKAQAAQVVAVDGEHSSVENDQEYSTLKPLGGLSKAIESDLLEEVQRDLAGEPLDAENKNTETKKVLPKKSLAALDDEVDQKDLIETKTLSPITLIPSTTTQSTTSTIKTTTTRSTPSPRPLTTPSFVPLFRVRPTESPEETPTTYKPGCLYDVILVLDSSGSVEETFRREKELAAGIIDRFRVGPDNTRVAIIKFAASQKVKTVWSFSNRQSRGVVQRTLRDIPFSSGTTAIHAAILRAISLYSEERGARPTRARPIAILFTDGFGEKSTTNEAQQLRKLIPLTFAIAINHLYPISRPELERITGDPQRVFTDANISEFHDVLETLTSDCDLS